MILVAAIGSVAAALITAFTPAGRRALRKLWHFITRYRARVPRGTIRITPQEGLQRWSEARVGGSRATSLDGRWRVTNVLPDREVLIVGARIAGHDAQHTYINTQHPERDIYSPEYLIPPLTVSKVMTDFYFVPPITRPGRDFKASLILIDQFGNEHKLKAIFKSPEKPAPRLPEPSEESLDAIEDPIAKDVASVLKAEVRSHRECGRSIGGLGSIQFAFQPERLSGFAREQPGVRGIRREAILKPGQATIASENADALLQLYGWYSDDDENQRTRFENALLRRLSRDTEYAPIGYFVFFVLFKVGKGAEALWKSRADVRLSGTLAFLDVLRLLDALLRVDHCSFPDALLDEIERFIEGLPEHFRIPERIAAIRTYRLSRARLIS
ncbi:MAG TPA: hypothetical protein VF376_03790 [Thermoanaerobaculia bacterium]